VGSIVALISNLDKYGNEFKQQMDDLNDMCEDRDVPKDLRRALREYLMKSKTIPKQQAQRELLAQRLSKTLNDRISEHTRGTILSKVWWAKSDRYGNEIPQEAKLAIVANMERKFFGPEECPLEQHMMIFVKEGRIRVNFRILTKGQVWGDTNILLDQPEIIMSRTMTYVDSFTLTQDNLKQAAKSHPMLDVRLRRAQVIMAIWRGIGRVRLHAYFAPHIYKPGEKKNGTIVSHRRSLPSFACANDVSTPAETWEANSEQLSKAVETLAEQVKLLREAQQKAHDFAKDQLEVTRTLAEKVERMANRR
jgi:uncharacterized protein (UPF0147 family)